MPTFEDFSNKREKYTASAFDATAGKVRGLQGDVYDQLLDLFLTLETDGNKITYGVRNLQKVERVFGIFDRFKNLFKKSIFADILDKAAGIFGLNEDYFGTFAETDETMLDKARKSALLRWGYDAGKDEILAGSYFQKLFSFPEVGQKVASLMNQAIAGGMSLADFKKTFKVAFVGQPGAGMLENHFNTNAFDLYQRIDRAANLAYADQLGLNYAIYSGTLKDNSRPKCVHSVNRVFSRPQIEEWKTESFQGKPTIGYDPFLDAAGYNCRHHWNWISDGIANHLLKKQQ